LALFDHPAEVGGGIVILTLFGRWIYDQIRGRRISMSDLAEFCRGKQEACASAMNTCFAVGDIQFASITECLKAVVLIQLKICKERGIDCEDIIKSLLYTSLSSGEKSKMKRRATDR
jgi:hypothetical protein